jgi:hypothetical protein
MVYSAPAIGCSFLDGEHITALPPDEGYAFHSAEYVGTVLSLALSPAG